MNSEILLVILQLGAISSFDLQSGYEITPIRDNPGIFFEQINPLRITHTTWKLVTALEIEDILTSKPNVDFQTRSIQKQCDLIRYKECPAERVKLEAKRRLADATKYEELLKNIIGEQRNKRALFEFIGTISKVLFGTLTENDAKYYNEEIDKVYADQKQLSELLENQTHIVRSEFKNIHTDLVNMENAVNKTNQNVKEIIQAVRTLEESQNNMGLQVSMSLWSTQLMRHVEEYISTLILLTDALTFAKLGILHPAVLSPTQITTACEKISRSTKYEFPLTMQELHTEQLKEVTNLHVTYTNGRIIIALEIPLLDKIHFDLYHLYPNPSFQEINRNTTVAVTIKPAAPFLAMREEETEYFLLEYKELEKCKKHNRMYICELSSALSNPKDESICETDFLIQPEKIEWKKCDVHLANTGNSITGKLTTPNTWLFSVKGKQDLKVRCENQLGGYEPLTGSGILRLKRNCQAIIGKKRIIATETINESLEIKLKPLFPLNISYVTANISMYHVQALTEQQEQKTQINNLKDLESGKSSTSLKDIEKEARNLSNHKRTKRLMEYIEYGGSSIGIIVIVIIVIVIFRCLKNQLHGCCITRRSIKTQERTRPGLRPRIETGELQIEVLRSPPTEWRQEERTKTHQEDRSGNRNHNILALPSIEDNRFTIY